MPNISIFWHIYVYIHTLYIDYITPAERELKGMNPMDGTKDKFSYVAKSHLSILLDCDVK